LLRNGVSTIASTGNTGAGSKGTHWHDFLTEWSEPSSPLHIGIPEIWMEYDNQDLRTHPVPSVFIGLPQEVSPSAETYGKIAVPSLDRLFGSDWHDCKDNLHRCFVHCPEPAFIGNIGIMLSRDSRSLRINVKRLQPDSLISYLQRLSWQGKTDELETLMARLFAFSDLITVCLDIGRKVRSRIGFECAVREQHPPLYHWDVFLDYLVEKGLCEPRKRAALLDWPGHTSPMNTEASWPDHLIAAALLKPKDHLGVFDRELRGP